MSARSSTNGASGAVHGLEIHERTLDCGLPVFVAPKPGFRKKYALLGINYGSIDCDFTSSVVGRRTRVPAGIAHFLEHKMFEKEDGDVTDKLAVLGCSTNAMTSFNHTGYLVECSENFEASLEILIDFVTRAYFTPALVEKEKGIIAEEIKMYRDDASWRGYMGVLENAYARHPLAVDIAGTLASIREITADQLHMCHQTFYNPANMHLAVAGDVAPERVFAVAQTVMERNGATPVEVRRYLPPPGGRRRRRRSVERMAISGPKVNIGWRIDPNDMDGATPTEIEVALEIVLGALIGRSGRVFQDLYQAGLVDDSFGYSVTAEPQFAFIVVNGDTPDPRLLEQRLLAGLAAALDSGLKPAEIRRIRRQMYGSFVRSFNSVSSICWNLVECHVKGVPYAEYGRTVMKISSARLHELARLALRESTVASTHLVPLHA